jgi:hypothetical protein
VTSKSKLRASCHCGTVQFETVLKDGFKTIRRCNCSFCRMRGAVVVSANLKDVVFTQGEDRLTLYQFKTNTAKHYFCSVCGIYTHHQRRSNPNEFGINVACIEGVSPFDFAEVQVFDGVNHPKDSGSADAVVGVLKFEETKV